MKSMYNHHYDKALIPVFVRLSDLSMDMRDSEYEDLQSQGFSGVNATVTIVRDVDGHKEIADVDVEWAPNTFVLYRERICTVVTDYIYSNEDAIVNGDLVSEAFSWMDERRKRHAA